MLNRKLFFGLLLIAVVASALARAFVVQEYKDATSYGNNIRLPEIPQKPVSNQNITEKLLPKAAQRTNKMATEKVYKVDLSNVNTKNLAIPRGYTVFFTIAEEEGADWKVDSSNEEAFKLLNSSKENGLRIFEFQAIQPAAVKIYFDKMLSGASIKSVIVKIKVE